LEYAISGLFHTLNIGAESLYANRQGVDTAGHNIANAQTEGYSRQRVNITQRIPSESRGNIIGNGVYVQSISRSHDKFIEKQLNLATQDSSSSEARKNALQAIEQIYSTELSSSISDQMTDFFNSLQTLSTAPEEVPMRTSVRESARDLVSSFTRVDFALKRHRSDLDGQLVDISKSADDLCRQIAEINVEILTLEAGRAEMANDLRDQQDNLLRKLSEKIDINYYINQHGALVVRGPAQALLVDGRVAAHIENIVDPDTGVNKVLVVDSERRSSKDITHNINSGEMRALIDVRDRVAPDLIHSNNLLAVSFTENVNRVHREGYGIGDFAEYSGRDFFEIPGALENAAQSIKIADVILEDVNSIAAAATPGAPGDNVIVNEILRLRGQPLMADGKMSFNEFYSDYVSLLGLDLERTNNQMESDKVVLGDLSKRREAVSGVSLDEEAVNLLRWQTAFAASSKVITTTDEMIETVLSLKR
jgi:flagellar hook-associated protein 1 FlgK